MANKIIFGLMACAVVFVIFAAGWGLGHTSGYNKGYQDGKDGLVRGLFRGKMAR